MKTPALPFLSRPLLLTVTAVALAANLHAQVVTDFNQNFSYAFLAWEKGISVSEGVARIEAKTGAGGAGLNVKLNLAAYGDWTPAMRLRLNPGHAAKRIRLIIGDADETNHEFLFNLENQPQGQWLRLTADNGASLRQPAQPPKNPGKEPGIDLANLTLLQVQGDWGKEAVDISLDRIELVEPDETLLTQRREFAAKQAQDEERQRKQAEERERKKQELLANASHRADGPDARHVALVAPDILAIAIQEKEVALTPQEPYEPAEGDETVRKGHEVQAWENGLIVSTKMDLEVVRKQKNRRQTLGNLVINHHRIKPPEKVTGQDLSEVTVDEPAAYRVSSTDDPQYAQPLQPTEVWWKRKPNAYRSQALLSQVFLKIPHPFKEGSTYQISFAGLNTRQESIAYTHRPTLTHSEAVHVSQTGYRPDDPFKRAYLSIWLGTGGAWSYENWKDMKFHLIEDATGKSVFQGKVTLAKGATDKESFKAGRNYSQTGVYHLDFSEFKRPGRYRVYVESIGCSYPFLIAEDVWLTTFRTGMKGLLHHRSGLELGPPFTDYRRPRPMHPADGVKVFASTATWIECAGQDEVFKRLAAGRTDQTLPNAWGGYMDAGDWDRNTWHLVNTTYPLLELFELYPAYFGKLKLALPNTEANNRLPDLLDEALWNLDFFRRLQTRDGGVRGGVESTAHPRPGECSWQESLVIMAAAPDPEAGYAFAANAAKLARLVKPLDQQLADTYRDAALKAWQWAEDHTAEILDRIEQNRRGKVADAIQKQRNLAAVELFWLTATSAFHDAFKKTSILADNNPQLPEQQDAIFTYARLPDELADAALKAKARDAIFKFAGIALDFADNNAFGLTTDVPQLPPMGFVGYCTVPGMITRTLPRAHYLSGDPKYLAGTVRACNFGLGANPDNLCYTTGLGANPVRYPLHLDSRNSGQPAPAGITVYGMSDPLENYGFDSWAYTWYLQKMVPQARTWPMFESYWDIGIVPSSNEYTVHQTIAPSAYYWGYLAARASGD